MPARYGIAVALPIVSLLATLAIRGYLGQGVFLLFFPAIGIAAWYGGTGPGVVATAMSVALSVWYLIGLESFLPLDLGDVVLVATFAAVALTLSRLSGVLWTERRRASESAVELSRVAHEMEEQATEAEAMAAELETTTEELQNTTLELEEARIRSEEERGRYESILDSIPDAVVTLDGDLRWTYVNPAARGALRELGVDPDRMVGHNVAEQLPALASTQFEAATRRAIDSGTQIEYTELIEPLGRWYETRIVPADGGATLFSRDVTERVRWEGALRQSEERYRALVDASTQMVWTTDRHGMLDDLPFWRQLTGQTIEQLRGDGWMDAIHPDDRSRVSDAWRRAYHSRTAYEADYRVKLLDGSYRWFHSRGVPVVEPDGTLREWVGVVNDVDRARRREQAIALLAQVSFALVQSTTDQETFRTIAHGAVPQLADWCAIDIVQDPEANAWPPVIKRAIMAHQDPTRVGVAEELMRHYPTDWSATTGLSRVIREGVPEFYPTITDEMIVAGARDEEHLRLVRALDFTSVIIVPILVGGRSHGAITLCTTASRRRYDEDDLWLATDLARRTAAAMERTKLYAAEQEARARTERAAERMQRLYAVTSGLARAITPNDVADTLLAEGRAALGASLGVLCMLRNDGETLEVVKMAGDNGAVDDRYRVFPLTAPFPIAECVRLREPIAIGSRTEFHERYPAVREATDRSPQQAWLSIPLFVDERAVGSIGFGFPTAREFTEEDMGLAVALAQQCAQALERARLYQAEREARAAAEEAQRRAEEASRAKSDFLATMSHELRTPLNAISGHAQLIEMGVHGPVTDDQRAALDRLQQNQRHLLGLITEILDFSKIEAGALRLHMRPVAVGDVLASIEPLIAPQFQSKGVRYCLRPSKDDPVMAFADRERLVQIGVNLLSNAVKATPAGGEVAVWYEKADADRVRVHFRDTGVGIPEDKLEEIFSPFTQLGRSLTSNHEGTGLGLAISRQLAREMRGELVVRSTVGEGSEFTVVLLAATGAEGAA